MTGESINAEFESFGTRIRYGTAVIATVDVADDVDARAIVSLFTFGPREESRWARWAKLLTGDDGLSLLTESDRPVIVPTSRGTEHND